MGNGLKKETSATCCVLITLPGPHVYPLLAAFRVVPLVAARAAPTSARTPGVAAAQSAASPRCFLRRPLAGLATLSPVSCAVPVVAPALRPCPLTPLELRRLGVLQLLRGGGGFSPV